MSIADLIVCTEPFLQVVPGHSHD